MTGKRDAARTALQRSAGFLASRHQDDILDSLEAEGLLDEPKNAANGGIHAVADAPPKKKSLLMTPMQASMARQENVELVRRCRATCARHGYVLKENEFVDVQALNTALSAADEGTRWRLKSELYSLRLIPA
jgi:hypothetical protein